MAINQYLGDPSVFLGQVFDALNEDNIPVADFELDHICYRVNSTERYRELKAQLFDLGDLLVESQVGGRSIATFKLFQPIIFRGRSIWVLELPAPKNGSDYPEGFEHVEFVIDTDLETFIKSHPEMEFEIKGLFKGDNPDVRRKYDGMSVKFHTKSLEQVIMEEI